MADFCKQCSLEHFGKDYKELAGASTSEDTANGLFATVICEGCGVVQVNHEGVCVSPDCAHQHGVQPEDRIKALLDKVKIAMEVMTTVEKIKMMEDQRASWVMGELRLSHPDMSPELARELVDKAISELVK